MPADPPKSSATLSGEASIIARFRRLASEPGAFSLRDDAAALTPSPGCDLVVTTDALAVGHHLPPDARPAAIGYRALAVNVSDLAAKGARPRWYLMALALPEPPTAEFLDGLADGLEQAQARFGITLVGGDTDRRPGPLVVDITAIGEVPRGKMVRRGGAKAGDLIFVSGSIGDGGLGLALSLASGGAAPACPVGLPDPARRGLVTRYLRPEPRLELREALLGFASAAMDVSDGLAKDLARMAEASGVEAVLELARVPLSPAAEAALASDPTLIETLVTAGDDYELIIAVPPSAKDGFLAAAGASGVRVEQVGAFRPGSGLVMLTAGGQRWRPERPGWDHF